MVVTNRVGNTKKTIVLIGLLLITVTLIFNNQLIAGLFPSYRVSVMTEIKVGIFAVDILFVLIAVGVLVWQKSKARVILDILVGVGFTLLMLAGVEMVFYFFNSQNPVEEAVLTPIGQLAGESWAESGDIHPFFQLDDWLGYKLTPDMQVAASRKKAGETLYDVIYSVDGLGRRVTAVDGGDAVSNFIMFFGGSFAFGEGVNDDETLPAYVSHFAPGYRSYNYGVGGYGPQQMLAKLQSGQLSTEIMEDGAHRILIYVFIRQHVGRAIGSMWIHNQRGEMMPYYYLDADGTLTRKGNFVSGRPVLSLLYHIAGRSQTLEYFGVSFPLSVGDSDFRTTARIFEESRDLFREEFSSDEFYVLIYPGLGIDEFLPYLEAAHLNYLDYSALPDAQGDDFWLGEGHPTAGAHKIVAEKLVRNLGLSDETKD